MNTPLPDLYRALGFTVTPFLQDVIDTYGEATVPPPVEEKVRIVELRGGRKVELETGWLIIEFCPRDHIDCPNHADSPEDYEEITAFMGSPVALVGLTHRRNIDLLLTEDGRLIGVFHGWLVMTWGPRGCDWRTTIAAYQADEKGRVLGHAGPRDPLPPEVLARPLPDLYRDHGFTLAPPLLDLIATHGESVCMPPGEAAVFRADGTLHWALAPAEAIQFCPREAIARRTNYEKHMHPHLAAFLGSPVAPVGYTEGEHIDLLLTEDGRLVGNHDFILTTWGAPGCGWRASIAARLAGEPARELGNARDAADKPELR